MFENLPRRYKDIKDIKVEIKIKSLLPPLKWAGIAAGVFVLDAALLGGVSAGLVKSVSKAVSAIKGLPPPDMAGPVWYFTHPFKAAWVFFRHMLGAPINVTKVYNTWAGLNAAFGICAITLIIRQRISKSEKGQERDIRKINFKKVAFDWDKEFKRVPEDQVFLGLDDKRKPVTVGWREMTEHMHVLGGSGTGKTSFAVIPVCVQAIRRGLSVIAIDFKGDKQAIQLLNREAKKAGKRFYIFSLHPQIRSNTYNPIGSGNTLSKVERVMTALDLVYNGPAKFYTYSQQAVFLQLLRHFDCQGVKCTLQDVQTLLKDPDLVGEILGEEINPGHLKGLAAALVPYADVSQINTHEADIDLARVMHAGDVVYFDLCSAVAPELAAGLGKMIALDLQVQAAFRTQTEHIALIAIDEFQNMACQAFRNIVTKVRSANYALLLANQAPGDLRAVGEDFLNVVFNNTRTKIVFGIEHPEDVELFAKKSGQVIIPVESRSKSLSKASGQVFSGSTTCRI